MTQGRKEGAGQGTEAMGAEHGEACQDLSQISRVGYHLCSQCTGWPRCGQLRLMMSWMRAMQEPDLGGGPRSFMKQSGPHIPAGTAQLHGVGF